MPQDRFRAKDIQRILDIPKHRYEYLTSKIGITPDIFEVEGRGRSHLYSSRNVVQFAYIHHANQVGLSPTACRKMISLFNSISKEVRFPIYQPDVGLRDDATIEPWQTRLFFYSFTMKDEQYFGLSYQGPDAWNFELYTRGRDLVDSYYGTPDLDFWWDGAMTSDYWKFIGQRNQWLNKSVAHVTMNLSLIMRDIQSRME